ncbi:MAG TPA: hypothetical protein VF546_16625 [Pyrinomonadaceae bacterium]
MATKSGSKKGGAVKATALPGECLSLSRAGRIVQDCSGGPHDVDDTLEEVGLITDNQRIVFRECVFQKVLEHGCKISRADIPNDADTTLRDVRNTISDLAG